VDAQDSVVGVTGKPALTLTRICAVCAEPIPVARLLAKPNADKCVSCLNAQGDVYVHRAPGLTTCYASNGDLGLKDPDIHEDKHGVIVAFPLRHVMVRDEDLQGGTVARNTGQYVTSEAGRSGRKSNGKKSWAKRRAHA
jgi:hypothetical protein